MNQEDEGDPPSMITSSATMDVTVRTKLVSGSLTLLYWISPVRKTRCPFLQYLKQVSRSPLLKTATRCQKVFCCIWPTSSRYCVCVARENSSTGCCKINKQMVNDNDASNQSINQAINQSFDQTINELINKSRRNYQPNFSSCLVEKEFKCPIWTK